MLPVGGDCPWRHNYGVAADDVCPSLRNGKIVANREDLISCVEEAACDITDGWHQMAIFRDPRPTTVSAYFFLKEHFDTPRTEVSIDQFVAKLFPIVCKWMAIRYHAFAVLLRHQSTLFWYEDAMADPLEWHRRWLDLAGLSFPADFVWKTTEVALSGDFSFHVKGLDRHPGGAAATADRTYQDEISQEVFESMGPVMRRWLQPEILKKLRV